MQRGCEIMNRIKHYFIVSFLMAVLLVIPIPTLVEAFGLSEATIAEIQEEMNAGELTAEELVLQYFERIDTYDQQGPRINSIITSNEDAVDIAKELDKEREENGPRGPLHGIPIIVKDNYDTVGMPTSAGCLCLKDSISPDDAHQIEKLKEAGAIILAKANLHEFAFGITTLSSLSGQTLNPYNLDYYPGGSSGGTGASIASNFAVAGLGTDTGGSIRIPSAFNSLVGIRPTMGLSSRDGIIPLALTQDVGGPMTRTVEDAAYLLDATVGYDEEDEVTARSVNRIPETYTEYLNKDGLNGARIGVIRELFNEDSHEVNELINGAITDMEEAGAEVVDVKVHNLDEITSYPSLSSWEFKFQLNDYLESLGDNAPYSSLEEIIQSGKYDESIERQLIERNNRETLYTQEYKDILLFRTKASKSGLLKTMADNDLDALVYPTTSHSAAKIGKRQNVGSNNRLSAFSGFPAISVPAGYTTLGLPVGIEFLARPFEEPTLIELAYAYEQKTHHRRPPELEQAPEVDKTDLQNLLNEINNEKLNESDYTEQSWQALQDAITGTENVLNNPEVTQAELDDALEVLNDARNGLEMTPISAEGMITLVEHLEKEGEFASDKAARSLKVHLTTVSNYEDQEEAEKVIKHMESFKVLLDHQKEDGLISNKVFETLRTQAERLIDKWEV